MKKQNKGITLVALVITIIVLIILAGVSINAVMNGGLITNAKDAKNEYQEAKDEEKITLSQLEIEEIEMEFLQKRIPYKYKKGYITGIDFGTTPEAFLAKFPKNEGYTISSQTENPEFIGTGMVLKKGTETIGTILIYGDIILQGASEGNGKLEGNDASRVISCINGGQVPNIKASMDVNFDGLVNWEDAEIMVNMQGGKFEKPNQNVYAISDENIKLEIWDVTYQNYINSIKNDQLKQRFVFDEDDWAYYFTGITTGTTVNELMSSYTWPENTIILDNNDKIITDNTTTILNGHSIAIQAKYNEHTLVREIAEIQITE